MTKLSDLTVKATVASTDLFPIVQNSQNYTVSWSVMKADVAAEAVGLYLPLLGGNLVGQLNQTGTHIVNSGNVTISGQGFGYKLASSDTVKMFETDGVTSYHNSTNTTIDPNPAISVSTDQTVYFRNTALGGWTFYDDTTDGTNAAFRITKVGRVIGNEDAVFRGSVKVGATNAELLSGTATPEGAVTAAIGSIFMRTDGGAGTSMYIKETGAGNTGWVGK